MSRLPGLGPALVLSALVAASLAANAWLLLATGISRQLLVAVLALEALLLTGAVWIAAAFLELKVFRPLRQLRDHLGILLHAEADHRFDIGAAHALGELPGCVEELSRQLSRERLETARVLEAAAERVDHRKSRLEAILRDLHEGVIVCNDDHRIVLFNQQAAAFFEGTGAIGLHRPLTALIDAGLAKRSYERLKARHGNAGERALLSRFTDRTTDGRQLEMRMSLIVEPEGACSGYVLTFPGSDGPEDGAVNSGSPGVLSERPEFYDFSLFESRPETADPAARLEALDYVVFDTETTGLNPSKGDAIVQISGVRLVGGRPTGEEFDTLVNPGVPIPQASIRFHGITDEMVARAPSAGEALRRFRAFTGDAVLVAHNAAFDMKFLKVRESESGVAFENAVLDTLLLSCILQPGHSSHTLDAIAARFGVSISDEVRHTALGDARATAEIFVKMLPVLARRGVETLGGALEASDRVFHVRRQQKKF